MPRESLDLVPDERGVRAVRAIWDRLGDAGLPSQARHHGRSNKVHLTLAEADVVSQPGRAVQAVAQMLPLTLPVTGLVVLGSGRAAAALAARDRRGHHAGVSDAAQYVVRRPSGIRIHSTM